MATNAERQRNRRARLRQKGIVDVTVTVPQAQAPALRSYAKALVNGDQQPKALDRFFEVIGALKSVRPLLKRQGILHAGVFGSTARGDHDDSSDIDIIIDIDTKKVCDLVDYVSVCGLIEDAVGEKCPGHRVEIANRASLKSRIRPEVDRDAIYAF
ncbi:MAG: hypothetical protein HOB79_08135 [Rhodospirillaceae bacterium]|jgi:hypothetical protein|nr:hypothetical protein [Rhodospirillales bacterium]MBT3906234.1 hypothetical protein [Rhodospirillaceae bacterium]MBT4701033.1 hypothetical protein [Rhodospirillaceae bacterium]MBT5033630.1 hypothetical protein [Rhodospirillaceae bacterium]MBT6221509.1 hypothetical protein [Rhodospirillaceae bacterium]